MDQNEQIVIRTRNFGKRCGGVQALEGVKSGKKTGSLKEV